jgi:UDP-glucose 4-epimerase
MTLDTAMGRRPVLSVYGDDFDTPDGSGVRDYIHVSDLAAAHVVVLQRLLAKAPVPTVVNCGYGRGSSVFEVLEATRSVIGREVPSTLAPRRPGDLAAVVADNARIKALGWMPRHDSLESMIGDAWKWELACAGG